MEITTEKKSDDKTTQPEEIILNIETVTTSNTILSSSNTIDMIERTTTPTITESTIFDLNDDSGKEQRGGKATTLRLETTTAMSFQRRAPPEPPELSKDIEEVEEKEIEITNATSTSKKSNHPFIRYFRRLRKIYELDLKILDQIASLLEGINDELLPQVADALEPLLVSQTVNMLDLGQILGYVAQTIHSSTFQLGASTSLGGLDFLKFG